MDTVKADIMYHLAIEYFGTVPDSGIYYTQKVLSLSEQIGYKKGIGNAFNAIGLTNMALKNYAVAMDYFQKALEIRIAIGDKKGMAWTYNNLGLMYGNMGQIEESINWHRKSLTIKEETGDSEGMAASYGKIGHDYSNLGKLPEALSNYLNALKIWEEENNKSQISGVYSDIGDIYYSAGNYPEALKNYHSQLRLANEALDNWQVAYAGVNIARILYKQGNDTAAANYFLASLKVAEEAKYWSEIAEIQYNLGLVYLAMNNYSLALSNADSSLKEWQVLDVPINISKAYIGVGYIYEKQGKLQDALDAVTKGLSIARQIGAKIEMKEAYRHLADINAEMQNYEAAYLDNKEYANNLDSLNSNESAKKIATLEINYAFNKREDSIRIGQEKDNIIKIEENNRKNIITGSAIIISLLTLVLAVVLINRQQIRRKKEKILFEKNLELSEKEKDLLKLEKRHIEDELSSAKTALDEYIQNMAEKNKLLEEFKLDIEKLKDSKGKELDKERMEKLEYLNKATILTDEDWNKFKYLFEHVHNDFFKRLKEKLPELTQSEIRLVSLTKLAIGTKQMAGILGVSFDTIKVSRHRLRKKLGLSEEDTLEDIANSI